MRWLLLAAAPLAACSAPEEQPPIGFCRVETQVDESAGPPVRSIRMDYVVLLDSGSGVYYDEHAHYPVTDQVCGWECFTSTRDIYEVSWEPTDGGFSLQTPGPDPLHWRCTVVPGGVNVDCEVTLADGSTETRLYSAREGGRTDDGLPYTLQGDRWKNRACIRSDTEHDPFYEDYWASW